MGYFLAVLVGVLAGLFGERGCDETAETAGAGGSGGDGGAGGVTVAATGTGGATGGGGQGGAGGETTTATTGGGEGGAGGQGGSTTSDGGGGCMIEPSPCAGGVCGVQDIGCGATFNCKCFGLGEVCNPDSGHCCVPADPVVACEGKCNVAVPDGCGGTIDCDGSCGDASGLMSCGGDGVCQCTDATTLPGADLAAANCFGQSKPFYCGAKTKDAPQGCGTGNQPIPPTNNALWCCDL